MVWMAIGVLYSAFLLVGWLASRKVRQGTVAELMLAGRNMPLWIAALTMTATWVDGGYLLGTAEGIYHSSLASGIQGGLCYGVSLILGGIFFAGRMRACEFTTLIDPFEIRFGKRWAAVLFVPAMLAEVFWSAELLVAIGSTFAVIAGLDLTSAVMLSAAVVTVYTMVGGLWSVAYTDVFQLGLVALGLLVALPFALDATGGLAAVWQGYLSARPERGGILPPVLPSGTFWTSQSIIGWWDMSLMLMLGGIPWNCYFQRVLACQTPARARWHSILSGMLTILFTVPPVILGLAAFRYGWPSELLAQLRDEPSRTLPLLLRYVTPPLVSLLGLGAIIGAVTSSFSSSILSAASMFSWNCCKRLLFPGIRMSRISALLRGAIAVLGIGAALLALKVKSVQALWFFTSDLVFVLLFPQLLYALFDRKVNRIGSIAAFLVSAVLRIGGGEPLFGIPPLIPYPELFAAWLPLDAARWHDPSSGAVLFPCRTLAAAVGLILMPLISRCTARWDPPKPLREATPEERNAG